MKPCWSIPVHPTLMFEKPSHLIPKMSRVLASCFFIFLHGWYVQAHQLAATCCHWKMSQCLPCKAIFTSNCKTVCRVILAFSKVAKCWLGTYMHAHVGSQNVYGPHIICHLLHIMHEARAILALNMSTRSAARRDAIPMDVFFYCDINFIHPSENFLSPSCSI